MAKKRVIFILLILINVIVIASFFLPYRIENNPNYGQSFPTTINNYEYLSGFKTILPLFALLFLTPITILFFTTKRKTGRIINLVLSIVLVVFSALCFLIMSFGLFISVKAGIGAYLLILCALVIFILTIVHLKMPTIGAKSKDLLDDYDF